MRFSKNTLSYSLLNLIKGEILLSLETKKRDGFSSTLAALMVSLGSAVGLGNIWKFPYMTGTGGGGAFLLVERRALRVGRRHELVHLWGARSGRPFAERQRHGGDQRRYAGR